MSLFETKIKSKYLCPRCNGRMFVVTRPILVNELQCETCDSVLGVEYVQGFWDGAKYQSAQQSVKRTADEPEQLPADEVVKNYNKAVVKSFRRR